MVDARSDHVRVANLSGESNLSVGPRLDAAGEVLRRVSKTQSTSWDVEDADPVERAAKATERMLKMSEVSREGIEALVKVPTVDSKWVSRTGWLTVLIALLTAATLVVAIATLVKTP